MTVVKFSVTLNILMTFIAMGNSSSPDPNFEYDDESNALLSSILDECQQESKNSNSMANFNSSQEQPVQEELMSKDELTNPQWDRNPIILSISDEYRLEWLNLISSTNVERPSTMQQTQGESALTSGPEYDDEFAKNIGKFYNIDISESNIGTSESNIGTSESNIGTSKSNNDDDFVQINDSDIGSDDSNDSFVVV